MVSTPVVARSEPVDLNPASAHVRNVTAVSALLQLKHVCLDEQWPESVSCTPAMKREGARTAVVADDNGHPTSHEAHSAHVERHRIAHGASGGTGRGGVSSSGPEA